MIRIADGEPCATGRKTSACTAPRSNAGINRGPGHGHACRADLGAHAAGGPGVRVDTMLYAGYAVPPYYTRARKLVVHAGPPKRHCPHARRARRAQVEGRADTRRCTSAMNEPASRGGFDPTLRVAGRPAS